MRGVVLFAFAALTCAATAAEPLSSYVARFRTEDGWTGTNAIPDAAAETFLERNIPIFECPDKEIERTYYFRWWTYRRHIRATPSGHVITEFLPNVSWAGKYNTISCAAGHHIMEGRWLRDPKYVDDYARFLFAEGTMNGPRAYVCWAAFALLERARLTGDWSFVESLLDRFVENYERWEKGWKRQPWPPRTPDEMFDMGLKENGLFATTDDREGAEYSLGGNGFRPLVNAAMVGEARAISEIAGRCGRADVQRRFADKAKRLEERLRAALWNPARDFFTTLAPSGERTSVRELIGYAPWYFGLDVARCGSAWRFLKRHDGFSAPCGLTGAEQSSPGFSIAYRDLTKTPCRHDGPSWPYETSIVLTALANALQTGCDTADVSESDYVALLHQYAAAHKLALPDGRTIPWIDENLDPFTGEWMARRIFLLRKAVSRYDRGRDYNHSTFCDLVLSGLCGIRVGTDGKIALHPLAPRHWDYFRVSNLHIQGREVEVIWDRTGEKYGKGAGLRLLPHP